jgi:calcineurin-like phosphoesterase family protein
MSKVFFTGCTHFDHANIIGPLIGEPSDNAGELAKQVASLKQQLTAVRTAVREATK